MQRQLRKGFTLIELLVVVAIIALLISILLPSLGRARELANRSACAANIKGIMTSMAVYGNENNDVLPLGGTNGLDGSTNATWSNDTLGSSATANGGTTAALALTAMHSNGTEPRNKILNPLWMMVLTQQVSPKSFLCKSDPSAASTPASPTGSNNNYFLYFTESNQVSYSIAYPWAKGGVGAGAAPWWRNSTDSSLPLMADMAPRAGSTNINLLSTNDNKARSSFNHNREGQNVGFADGHAEWTRTPAVGQSQDDIWTLSSNSSINSVGPNLAVSGSNTQAWGTALVNSSPFDIFMAPNTAGNRSGSAF